MLFQQHCEQIVFPHLSWIGLATTSKQIQHKSWSRKGDCSNCGLVSSSLKGDCGAIEWMYWTTALGVTPVGLPLPLTALGCLPPFATCWKCEQISTIFFSERTWSNTYIWCATDSNKRLQIKRMIFTRINCLGSFLSFLLLATTYSAVSH